MADVNISKYRASVVREGSTPASPGFVVSEGQDPVHPSGSSNFVPYSGAIASVELGEFGVEAGFITLDTTPTNTPTDQGTIFWDADDETVDIVLNGYTMKIGEDLFYPVKNQTGSTIAKGVAVRFNGTVGNSGRLLIAPFIADGSVPSSRFMGVTAEEILNGEDGKVLYFGRVRGINTNAFNEGDILYASTTSAGGYQTAIPVAPNNIVQVAAVVTKSATVGTIFVRPTLGSNINKDEGVKIVSVADKNLLQYQSGTSLWENKTLAQVLGGTSAQFVKGDGSLDSTSYGTGTVTSVGLSSATSGVTIGSTPVTTSGTITLAIATASGSQNGLLSSTDWTTFNGKQNALTNPVTGTGTSGQVAYFTGTTAISSESNLFWDATNDRLGILTSNPLASLQVGNGTQTAINEAGNKIHIATNSTRSALVTLANSSGGATVEGIFESSAESADLRVILGATSNHAVILRSNNTEAMRIFTSRNVHIGSTPSSDNGARLQVSGTATVSSSVTALNAIFSGTGSAFADGLRINRNSNTNQYTVINHLGGATNIVSVDQSGNNIAEIYFGRSINGSSITTSMMINKNGNVGIGVDANAWGGTNVKALEVYLASISASLTWGSAFTFNTFYNGSNWKYIGPYTAGKYEIGGDEHIFSNAPSGSAGATATFTTTMKITSGGNVLIGTETNYGQKMVVYSSGTTRMRIDGGGNNSGVLLAESGTSQWSLASVSGSLLFYNEPNAATRMTITSGGNVLIGTTTDVGRVSVDYSDTNNNGISINETSGVGSTFLMLFRSNNVNKGSIQINSGVTGVNFNTTSDYRLKEDLKDYNGFEIINKIKTYDYKWINTNFRSYGVLAHELQELIPDIISGKKDEIDDEGNEIMQGVDYSKLVPIMVKAIQELKQEIDTLKN